MLGEEPVTNVSAIRSLPASSTSPRPARFDTQVTWLESIAKWRALDPTERTRIRLERVPRQVAQSMAFEREPVSEQRLEELHGRPTAPRGGSFVELRSLTKLQLAPHLAERALRIAGRIARGELAALSFDDDLIRLLHRALCGDLLPAIAGRWRDREVMVGGHDPPAAYKVPVLIREYALDLHERLKHVDEDPDRLLEALAFAEHRLLYIHPFVDLNGRVTRLALAELLRRLDLPAADVAPADGHPREHYFAALRSGDVGDLAPLMMIWAERLAQG